MRIPRPSPAMTVAIAALVFATAGTAVAAVDYARRAGSVDGRSAVSANASLRQAAGRLVATQRSGANKGRIPGKFLADVVRGGSGSIAKLLQVGDNSPGSPTVIAEVPGMGNLLATCGDSDGRPGPETADTTISFQPTVAPGVNYKISLGSDERADRPPRIGFIPTGAPRAISGGGAFELLFERAGINVMVDGATRTEQNGTQNATCLVFGVALRLSQRR